MDHTITTDPCTFFYAWIGVWTYGDPGLQVGWMETDTFDFRKPDGTQKQVTFYPLDCGLNRYSEPGDKQYLVAENPSEIYIYTQFDLQPGMRIYVHIRHIEDGKYACFVSNVTNPEDPFVRLDDTITDFGWPNNQAPITTVSTEVQIGDASSQIPGCPTGYGYRLEVRNTQTYHHGTRFWPIEIKLQDDPPDHLPPGSPGWESWAETLGAITYETRELPDGTPVPYDGPYAGEWLLPNPQFPWIKADTRYYSWIFYTECGLTIDSQDQYGNSVYAKVWIDGELVGYCGDTFIVVPGWHEITVESMLSTGGKEYTFQQWSDGVTDNPRGIDISDDTVLTANYYEGPRHDVAVTTVSASPTLVGVGENVTIDVTVQNQGTFEEDFRVDVYRQSNSTGSMFIGYQWVSDLAAGDSRMLTFYWDTEHADPETYNIFAHAYPVLMETDTEDNWGYFDGTVTVEYHDVAVTNVVPSPVSVLTGEPVTITVDVENQGDYAETFNVTTYYDSTAIYTQTVTNLGAGDSTTLTFVWDTADVPLGTYTIKAEATTVLGETDTDDNTYIDGLVGVYPVRNINTGLNYATIQQAINAPETSPGDTIYVSSGTYNEKITINKYNLTLVGEDKSTTIIDGGAGAYGSVVTITADHATVSNFTVQGGGGWEKARIHLDHTSYNTISNNRILGIPTAGCWADIYLYDSHNNIISNNLIDYSSEYGIMLWYSSYNTINNNTISHCHADGVNLRTGSNNNFIYNNTISNNGHAHYGTGIIIIAYNNIISDNTISNNYEGIALMKSNNIVTGNTICSNTVGMWTYYGGSTFYHNNFIDNTDLGFPGSSSNVWDNGAEGNYWSDYTGVDLNEDGIGDTPHIMNEFNQDNYPLMHPWGSIQNVDTGSIYVSIQKAINAPETENGHTIKVKADTYYEHVVVNKSLTLIGEDPSTTIIDGKSTGNVVTVQANNVRISGFMIQNGDNGIYIDEYSNSNTIGSNTISNNEIGVYLSQNTENNTVSDNVVSNNDLEGIFAESSDGNSIYRNTVSSSGNGITLSSSDSNWLNHNKVLNNSGNGINLLSSSYNTLCENTVSNNAYGIYLKTSRDNTIHHNNFINNTEQIRLIGSQSNTWHSINLVGNYWSDYNGNDTNGDGIGDTLLPHQGIDSYPLMWKWFPGDLDGDGDVDFEDFYIFSGTYGSQMGDPYYKPIADLDYDGDVDDDDFAIFEQNYGKSDN